GIGRREDGSERAGYYKVETFLRLRRETDWPVNARYGRARTKAELVADLEEELEQQFPGVDFDVSQIIRDNVMEALSGVKGENSIKIFGPDLDRLEGLAAQARDVIGGVRG